MNDDRYSLDMAAIVQEALGPRRWRLEFDCKGSPYVWTGKAPNEAQAEAIALDALTVSESDFKPHLARLKTCVEQMA